ncbi:ABC transporter substrate-binding protein [Paenibacillus apiarius]|uniref:ABC transporter substrate-binding protein n=1 Tax=Paenibacillus apiarius TaxID=46240 RepID=A0ABT4DXG5_9BACL|nr:ABC transporter substrate-binding protein [Paenibacillus apiarius]MCY9512889.1 ABC transporter substrate-binding protein [Paenibacillus apiarius]MCY9522062.1 ABC transporter substrate-binding protein [Paenibacillus apiarius]MCY9554119.1 ABC transporter substrate-binding protein [Paenibacillus apiarius]MCY9558822.1 ABC transporter substrate-binding protein [Paenibacillus apiarius]MCY9683869.1 ABC transporter substrate-binding protein [Paenibacillus apiarius]
MNAKTRRTRKLYLLLAGLIIIIGAAALITNILSSESRTAASEPALPDADPVQTEAAAGEALKVASVSLDTADAVLELVAPEQVVTVPKSIANPYLASNHEKGRQVAGQVGGAAGLDPEGILSFNPDIVLITKLHSSESDAEQLLRQAGVKVVTFEQWGTFDELIANFHTIGEAVGAPEKANIIGNEIKEKLNEVSKRTATLTTKPTVLVLSPVGPNTGPYVIGPGNIADEMIRLAGAEPAANTLGIKKSTKASIEDLINIDPEYIVLGDWDGTGEEWLSDLKSQPSWNALRAVKNGRITTMKAKHLLAPNRYTVDGLMEMSAWLHPDLWEGGEKSDE